MPSLRNLCVFKSSLGINDGCLEKVCWFSKTSWLSLNLQLRECWAEARRSCFIVQLLSRIFCSFLSWVVAVAVLNLRQPGIRQWNGLHTKWNGTKSSLDCSMFVLALLSGVLSRHERTLLLSSWGDKWHHSLHRTWFASTVMNMAVKVGYK